MFWEEHLKRVVVILKKAIANTAATPFRTTPKYNISRNIFADGPVAW